MTNQELFDRVVAHARQQKCQAREGSKCLYRRPNGAKCFIGALIPDDKYDPSFENVGLSMLNSNYKGDKQVALQIAEASGLDESQYALGEQLQNIHDNIDTEEWESEFKHFAIEHSLIYIAPPTE
jgi:hypothetical protein